MTGAGKCKRRGYGGRETAFFDNSMNGPAFGGTWESSEGRGHGSREDNSE